MNYWFWLYLNQSQKMHLQQLEYVVALDNHRHYVRAAESCFVTQPTLTMQVKKLEEEIGIRLFNRKKKPLVPTEAGKKFIERARSILLEVNQLKSLVKDETDEVEGEFRLAIIPTLAPYLLPLFLPQFLKAYPNTKLIIEELQTSQIIESLQKGHCDIALLATPLDESGLREIPVFEETFMIYHHENDPNFVDGKVEPNSLSNDDLLLLEEGHCFREQTLNLCHSRAEKSNKGFVFQSGSIEALMRLVDRGLGYTLVPKLSVQNDLNNKNLSRFKSPQPAREISLVVNNTFTKEALLESLHSCILQSLPEETEKHNKTRRVKWR